MELGSEEGIASFKPIFNRARGALDPSSPHARNAALLPFLLHAYACESGSLQILASDFHSNTWHTRLSYEHLKELKEKLACKDTFLNFLQSLHEALSSNEVKIELGGPASAVGGKGATVAKLKTFFSALGTSRDIVIPLEIFKGRSASDAVGALALDLYDAFTSAQNRISELEANVEDEKQRSTNVLNAILEGKADSIHFRQSTLPSMVQNEVQPSWSDATSPGLLMPTQSPVPSVSLSSYLSPSLPPPLPNDFSPGYNVALAHKPYKSSGGSLSRKRGVCRNTALKLSDENSYSRSVKNTAKMVERLVEVNTNGNGVLSADIYETTGCSGGAVASHIGAEKRKYRELNADLLAKIESGGENRSAKTDAWARRHYLEWRRNSDLPEREIEELPLPEFAESLVKFFCMVKKRNGDLFPSESLKAMYRGYVRIIQSHYKKLCMQGSYNGPIVDAGKDLVFEKARISCVEAMKHSLLQGANESKRRKADDVMVSLSQDILSCPENQATTPKGLCRRLCYYAIHKFGINGNMELYDTTDFEFQRIISDQGDALWEYNEKRAEKYKSKELFRAVVQCGDKDVVECFDKYFMHLPPKPLEEEPRRLFLAPIKRPTTNAWFRHQNISSRTLLEWYRYMKPIPLDQAHAIKSPLHHSPCLLRCDRRCNEKETDLDTNLNLPAMDISDTHMTNAKTTHNGTSRDIVDVPGNTDEDSNEGHAREDQDEDDLTDVDSHD